MRYFLISFLFLLLSSCSLSTTKGYIEHTPSKKTIVNHYFSNLKKDYVYKAKFEVYKHHFGGLLIIKKLNENHHRIVFTTEFGNKIFDFEFKNNTFKVNYILDELNKKIIINTLQNDLQLLVKQNSTVSKEFSNTGETLYQSHTNKRYNYYVFSKEDKQLAKIISTSKHKEKMTIFYNNVNLSIAKNINIKHQNIKMNIELNYISN